MNITQTFYDNLASKYDKLFLDWKATTHEQALILNKIFKNNGFDMDDLRRSSEIKKAKDMNDNPLILFQNEWNIRMTLENNKGLELMEVLER